MLTVETVSTLYNLNTKSQIQFPPEVLTTDCIVYITLPLSKMSQHMFIIDLIEITVVFQDLYIISQENPIC